MAAGIVALVPVELVIVPVVAAAVYPRLVGLPVIPVIIAESTYSLVVA